MIYPYEKRKSFYAALPHLQADFCERAYLSEQVSGRLNTCLDKWAPQRPSHNCLSKLQAIALYLNFTPEGLLFRTFFLHSSSSSSLFLPWYKKYFIYFPYKPNT